MNVLLRRIAVLVSVLAAGMAHGAITCTVTSGGFAAAYVPASPSMSITPTSFRVTCTKGAIGDPASVNFGVTVDNGLYAQGINNRASSGAALIRYDVFRDAACAATWKGATAITGTVSTPTTGTFSTNVSFWGCIAAGLNPAAGVYLDTVTMTMTYGPGAGTTTTGSFGVSITTPPFCSISPPSAIVVNYAAFQAATNPTAPFSVTCSNGLSYTMVLSPTAVTLPAIGISYTIAFTPAVTTGTGLPQSYSIAVTVPGGQAGTCSSSTTACAQAQVHTLTITY